MERRLFRVLKAELRRIGRRRTDGRQTHTDASIVEVYFWGVHHDRSTNWACQSENWVGVCRRAPLPSQPTVSRRLGTERVQRLIHTIERRLRTAQQQKSIVFMLDGKVLPIGPHSRDPDATWGRVFGGKGKGEAWKWRSGIQWERWPPITRTPSTRFAASAFSPNSATWSWFGC